MLDLSTTYGSLCRGYEKLILDRRRYASLRPMTCPTVMYSSPLPPAPNGAKYNLLVPVHFYHPEKFGGTERFTANLCRTLIAMGHTVRVLTLSQMDKSAFPHRVGDILWREYVQDGVPVTAIRYEKTPLGLYYKRVDSEDRALYNFSAFLFGKYGFNRVHFAYPQPFAALARYCCDHTVPYGATLTDYALCCHSVTLIDREGHFCDHCDCAVRCPTLECRDFVRRTHEVNALLDGARYVAAPSEYAAGTLANRLSVRPYVIPHGIDSSFGNVPRTLLKRFGFAGTLIPPKGVEILLHAFRRLTGNEYSLTIAGGGNQRYLKKLSDIAGNDPRIHFCGQIPPKQMAGFYREVDCVVVPSLWAETYNFVVGEAQSAGCTVIASDIGALHERADILFTPGDVDSLLRAMQDATPTARHSIPTVEEEARAYLGLFTL